MPNLKIWNPASLESAFRRSDNTSPVPAILLLHNPENPIYRYFHPHLRVSSGEKDEFATFEDLWNQDSEQNQKQNRYQREPGSGQRPFSPTDRTARWKLEARTIFELMNCRGSHGTGDYVPRTEMESNQKVLRILKQQFLPFSRIQRRPR